jgi:hypothetical protein
MQVDVNSVVLAALIYSALHGLFFIADVRGATGEADGGEVMTTIRNSILAYVDDALFGAIQTNS